jgi:acetoin utilization deacetylase AcuC-like enzyme
MERFMPVAFITHPDCLKHEMGAQHPECPQRLGAVGDQLIASGLDPQLVHYEAPLATDEQLARVHPPDYVQAIRDTAPEHGTVHLDPDTAMNPYTLNAALRAAGAAAFAVDLVLGGKHPAAFCNVRPPGHHACRARPMGFCIFNNVAVAARHAVHAHGIERVAIVDFDVHHGNGTEDIVAGDERILMASFFQHPLYPGSGAVPKGTNMINLPVAPYTRGPEIRKLIEAHWMPRLDEFKPEMLFVSAGFDAHREDELGQLGLIEADYEWMTLQLKQLAERHAQGRIVSCLEGGYNLGALARSVASHLRVLAEV